MSDLDATLDWAAHNRGNGARMAEIGFCFGGRNTWLYAAHNPNLKAAVAFYGLIKSPTSDIKPKTVLEIADQLHCPLLGLYGGQDQIIPVALVHQAEDKAKAAGKTVEIVRLSGRAARLPCRLSAELSQGRCRGRLAAHDRLAEALRRGSEAG